jgi:hypothetical protein
MYEVWHQSTIRIGVIAREMVYTNINNTVFPLNLQWTYCKLLTFVVMMGVEMGRDVQAEFNDRLIC